MLINNILCCETLHKFIRTSYCKVRGDVGYNKSDITRFMIGINSMGKRIGNRYEIQDGDNNILGVGGMGTVYRGIDTITNDPVAIKELKLEVLHGSPEILERFEREADALRILNHPNIVKVLASIAEDDRHYIIMEYVTGGSLRDLIQASGHLSIERVLEFSLDLADALTRAHRLKIIHRDIKPANVMIAEDGTPRLTDFGVARIDQKTRMTETGMVVGTLSYLSPESLDGSKPDERQDIWAFGIMLYEMLTGTRPFDGDTASAVITGILTKPVPDIMELRSDIPKGLIRLIQAMLQKDPNERINSVRKVGTEIENIIRGVDSDEYDLDSDLVHAVIDADKSRFESESDEDITPISPLTSAMPATKYGIPQHTGVKVMQDESGNDVFLMPAGVAKKGRRVFMLMFVAIIVMGIALFAILRGGDDDTNDIFASVATQWTENIPTVTDSEYLVLLMAQPELAENKNLKDAYVDVVETLQLDIPFSNVKAFPVDTTADTLLDATQLLRKTSADILVWAELEEDQIDYWILAGNPKATNTQFDAETLTQLTTVEVIITEDGQTITPYILGALSILHTTNGDIFESMRTLAILEEINDQPATLESLGTSQHFFSFFNLFLNDTNASIDAITQAIELDGGNPIWYVMRAMAHMRLGEGEQAIRDAKTAERIGPDGWSFPLVIQGASADIYGSQIDLLNTALDYQDDWFIYYLRSTFKYATNDLDGAWDDVEASIDNNPQANAPYVTGFLIAMRDGRIEDAGEMMAKMVKDKPDPALGNRVLKALFGDNTVDILMSGMLYEGYGNIVLGQYESVTAFEPQLQELLFEFRELLTSLDTESLQDTQRYFAGDVFSMMGTAYCALGEYDDAMKWLTQGIQVDPTSAMLRYIRTAVTSELGMEDLVQEDVAVIAGLSDEMNDLIRAGENDEIHCDDFFDYFVALGNS